MAIYHLHAHVVSRGKGQSVIAKAAYNSRSKLEDERTGLTKDYSRNNGDVMFSGIFSPKNAPEWVNDRQQLWNEVERREDRSTRPATAQLAREIEVSLPHELSIQEREWLVKDFVREQITRKGMIADVSIHAPHTDRDERNYHAHILVTMRSVGPDGFGPKVREWNDDAQLEQWREKWEEMANKQLERHGHDARIDRRTLEAQGIDRQPTTHRGPHVDAIERRGVEADNARENSDRRAELAELRAALSNITRDIAAERNERAAEATAAPEHQPEPANQNERESVPADLATDATTRRAHFERMLSDNAYRAQYIQKQREAEEREAARQRGQNQNDNVPDWTERGGMTAQQDAALKYDRKVKEHADSKRAEKDNVNDTSDVTPTDETKERRREARERREKPSLEDVIEDLRSGGSGRDYRQR